MAINYRPTAVLHDKLREESEKTGKSIQQIIDDSVTEHFDRQLNTWGTLASGFVGNNQSMFDKLADL